jgi:hypothetical protein
MALSERSHRRTKTVDPSIATCAAVSLLAFLFTFHPASAAPDSDILKQAQ